MSEATTTCDATTPYRVQQWTSTGWRTIRHLHTHNLRTVTLVEGDAYATGTRLRIVSATSIVLADIDGRV